MADLTDAIAVLRRKREELIEQVSKIDVAIQALQDVSGEPIPTNGAKGTPGPPSRFGTPLGRGVQTRVASLLEEYDREWTVGDIIETFERRNDALTSASPKNAVRTALVNLNKAGKAERVGAGRYRATSFGPRSNSDLGAVFKREVVAAS